MKSFFCNFEKITSTDKDSLIRNRKPTSIQEGMSTSEIAEVVSDKVMKEIKRQFKLTEKNYLSKQKNGI